MKKFIEEFKEFALQGNVMDMAVGVVIGGAFKAIIDSFVENLINPIIGLVAGKDLSNYALVINDQLSINYGAFISSVLNFILIALVIFMMVKAVSKARSRFEKPAEEDTKECPYCLNAIPIAATRCGFCTSEQPKA